MPAACTMTHPFICGRVFGWLDVEWGLTDTSPAPSNLLRCVLAHPGLSAWLNQGVKNLFNRMERMKATKPLFADFTWGAGGSTAELTLELTMRTKKEQGLVPNMHLTCTNMPAEKVDEALAACKVCLVSLLVWKLSVTRWPEVEGRNALSLDRGAGVVVGVMLVEELDWPG